MAGGLTFRGLKKVGDMAAEAAKPVKNARAALADADAGVFGLNDGVDAVADETESDDGEQEPAVGLLGEGVECAAEAAGFAGAGVPGGDDQEAADDEKDDGAGGGAEAADPAHDLARSPGHLAGMKLLIRIQLPGVPDLRHCVCEESYADAH